MTKNEAVQVNQIYSIFKRPLFSGHLCYEIYNLFIVAIYLLPMYIQKCTTII